MRRKLIAPMVAVDLAGGAAILWAVDHGDTVLAGAAGGVTLLASLLLTVWLSRLVTRPLAAVQRATDEFRGGNFAHKVEVRSNDEVGRLARALNTMGDRLIRTTVDRDYVDNILMSMRDALFVVSREGIIRTANNAALTWLGYRDDELVGKPVHKVLPETETPAETDNLDQRKKRR